MGEESVGGWEGIIRLMEGKRRRGEGVAWGTDKSHIKGGYGGRGGEGLAVNFRRRLCGGGERGWESV